MKLFEKIRLGDRTLKNRIAMSAMTRSRADLNGIVGQITTVYYSQRATAGLIISEGINVSAEAVGSPMTPGLYTKEQIEAWKGVTSSVHDRGGVFYAQLWHTGRVGHSIDKNGILPVAPSAIAIANQKHFTTQGPKDYETPRALTTEGIKQTILHYRQAAINAIEAGFDGVELHAANGYLPNQFLAESANQRTDEYGGSIENNSRFVLEVMRELTDAIGGYRVGIKISPFQSYAGISLKDPIDTFTYLIQQLNGLNIGFIELMKRSPMFPLPPGYPETDEIEFFGPMVKHTLIANTGYGRDTGEAELKKGIADIISYGSLMLVNPDLPKRFFDNANLNQADRRTMFGGNEVGYTDYPFLEDDEAFPVRNSNVL